MGEVRRTPGRDPGEENAEGALSGGAPRGSSDRAQACGAGSHNLPSLEECVSEDPQRSRQRPLQVTAPFPFFHPQLQEQQGEEGNTNAGRSAEQ